MTPIEAFAIVGIGYSLFHALPKIVRGLTLSRAIPVAHDQHGAAGQLAANGIAAIKSAPQRLITNRSWRNDAARSGPSRPSGTNFSVSLDEHEAAIAEAFARGMAFQQQRERIGLYAVDAPSAEIFQFPTNEKTAS
ncbi:MAG: hypothetical protein KGZ65_06195 [Sphingomonadales bacterium]|nr:hypothetical protein [Sphingomonadaceae bacterium]MBS3930810.1 hypothetical protein [Sphingomonadales bacterium]